MSIEYRNIYIISNKNTKKVFNIKSYYYIVLALNLSGLNHLKYFKP